MVRLKPEGPSTREAARLSTDEDEGRGGGFELEEHSGPVSAGSFCVCLSVCGAVVYLDW